MSKTVTCAFCKGKGRHPDTGGWSNTKSEPCPVCGGSGVAKIPDESYKPCSGKGKDKGKCHK